MNLYLHIGTEKTGSSFIQTSLGQSREALQQSGFYFPKAGKVEKKMLAGQISPGNGAELRLLLKGMRFDQVTSLLKEYMKKADKAGCNNIVLSNELLFEELGNSVVVSRFMAVLRELKLELKPLLLVVREPVEQALSLYQHRSKSGTTPSLEEWLKEGFVVPEKLSDFLDEIDRTGIQVEIRKYKKESSFLMKIVVEEWLKSPKSIPWKDQVVNPSLTLSELEVIRQYRQINPWVVEFLYQDLLRIPRDKKSSDQALRTAFQKIIRKEILKNPKVWRRLNEHLPFTEQLTAFLEPSNLQYKNDEEFTFSKVQLEAIILFQNEIQTTGFKLKLLAKKIRRTLSKIIKALIRK